MKFPRLLLFSAIIASSSAIAQFEDQANKNELFDEMDSELDGCTAEEQQALTITVQGLQGQLKDSQRKSAELNQQLDTAQSELTKYQAQEKQQTASLASLQQQLTSLRNENSRLQGATDKEAETRKNAGEIVIYASQLEGQIGSLNQQLKDRNTQIDQLRQQLAQSKSQSEQLRGQINQIQQTQHQSMPTSIPSNAQTKPVTVARQTAQEIPGAQDGKIIGQVLSMRREKSKDNQDQIVLGISLTNTTNNTIYGIMVGPEASAIDNANNMFSQRDVRQFQGITLCSSGYKLYNQMEWCEDQINKGRFSTTSFRPGVAVNILATLPAISSDPNTESSTVNASLFLLLHDEKANTFEKFPVDVHYARQ